ncbi:MAG: hypothetical protein DIU52_014285 [bacterium]|jgi:hypothetical protein|nr:MAG: hypothetical protein DIU52_05500 [bacterium]
MTPRIAAALLALALVVAGCGDSETRGARPAAAAPGAPGRQYIVALDLSGSQSEKRLSESRQALDGIIDRLTYGDRIVLLQVHRLRAQEDDARRWWDTVPRPRDPARPTSLDRERLEGVKQAARSVARALFATDSAGKLPTTDLFATLHVAAEFVRDAGGRRTTIVLLSDMLQSAHGIEMSRPDGTPSAEWIAAQRERGLLPRLDDACVLVVGADPTGPRGVRVREFWVRYFEAAGAHLPPEHYRLIWTGAAPDGCG